MVSEREHALECALREVTTRFASVITGREIPGDMEAIERANRALRMEHGKAVENKNNAEKCLSDFAEAGQNTGNHGETGI